jgi:hypothetical protein
MAAARRRIAFQGDPLPDGCGHDPTEADRAPSPGRFENREGSIMRITAIAMSLVALWPGSGMAQGIPDCYDCVLGLYDDPGLTETRGSIEPGIPKDIYVGVKLAGAYTDLAAIEFSIAGFTDDDGLMLLGAWPLGPRALAWGTVPSPRDTTRDSEGDGGVTVAWSDCRADNQALVKLTLFTSLALQDKMLVIKRSYPTTSTLWKTPVFVQCDEPVFTVTRLTGGCFVLNASPGMPNLCQDPNLLAVERRSWTAVKRLFD